MVAGRQADRLQQHDAPGRFSLTRLTRFTRLTRASPASPASKSDVRVITSAVYRANGGGWNDPDRQSHVWVTEVKSGGEIAKATQLTSGKYSEGGHAWSPDGSKIYFTSTRVDEPYYFQSDSDLYSVPAGGGDISKVASINGSIGGPRPSPDGKWIAFNGSLYGAPERSYDQSDLFVAPSDGSGPPRNLTAKYDFDIGGGVGGDQRAPRGGGAGGAIWSADGKSIITVAGEQGSANLVRIDVATGAVAPVYQGAHTVQAYSATPDAQRHRGRDLDRHEHQRSVRPRHRFSVEREADYPRQRCPIQDHQAERARRSVVDELRRTQDPGLGAPSARLRQVEAVSVHPRRFTAARTRPTATSSPTSFTGWPRRATSCCFRIRAAAATTARSSATSSSIAIRATTIRT